MPFAHCVHVCGRLLCVSVVTQGLETYRLNVLSTSNVCTRCVPAATACCTQQISRPQHGCTPAIHKKRGKKEKNPSQITPSHPTPSQNFFFVVVKVAAEAAEAAVESWPLSLFHSRLSVSSEVSQDNWFPQALFFISFFFSLLNAAFGAVYYTCLPRFIADGRGWGTFAQISLF